MLKVVVVLVKVISNRYVSLTVDATMVLCQSQLYFSFSYSDILLFGKFACYKIDNISSSAVSSQYTIIQSNFNGSITFGP